MAPYLFLLLLCGTLNKVSGKFEPTWDSLDNRTIPDWYDKAKIGIFLHWGVYSVPSFGSEWFWHYWREGNQDYVDFMEKNYPPSFTYQDFAKEFTAEFYDPTQWASLFEKSGAKYVVLTSKHHEGFALWPSKYSYSWNANDLGPHRDLIGSYILSKQRTLLLFYSGDLADAIKEKGLHFGLYHSLFEWYHPLYQNDKLNNWSTTEFVDWKVMLEMKELVTNYQPEVVWSDGDGEAPDTYWKSTEFIAWLYNESPVKDVVVVNDRWGSGISCKHGDFYTCADRYNPGHLLLHKWENCMTVDKKSWGYRRNAVLSDILTTHELIVTLTETVSCGGNILINVGPTKAGIIIPVFQERLLDLGTWLSINGEAIYESSPWTVQNDTLTSGVWYTTKSPSVYAVILNWPDNNILNLGAVNSLFESTDTQVTLLGNDGQLPWVVGADQVTVTFPDKADVLTEITLGYNRSPKIIEVPSSKIRYEPTWESLDTRPIPKWFDEAKIGIFIHWGVFSVPSFGGEWFWEDWKGSKSKKFVDFIENNYSPGFSYQEFAKDFTAEFFNPDDWAQLFKNAGAKYVVLTSKHHEGYTLWPSKYSFGWNAKDIGPHRDLIGQLISNHELRTISNNKSIDFPDDLAKAVRDNGLTFGVYHSLYEWFNPIYLADKNNSFVTQDFVNNKILPEMYELINNYQPSVLWSDGDWEANDTYWRATEFLAWLYNDSPVKDTVLVNDRWGIGIPCQHGDFYSCKDRYNPGVLQSHKWENAMTLDKESWGYRRDANLSDYLTTHDLLKILTETVSCGGNILINIGPTKEGTIVPIFQERLLNLGKWLSVNGEAIYKSKSWTVQNDTLTSNVWYTTDSDKNNVYAIVLQWPDNNILQLKSAVDIFTNSTVTASLLGTSGSLKWIVSDEIVRIHFPDKATVTSDWAWPKILYVTTKVQTFLKYLQTCSDMNLREKVLT
ncbi:alpha-L-fucosidase-like [Asbolus verrucosus]|uniref:Putative alpha-L-fucosidase n=1 Tax=Asbolus verrucosus TaxID=1661398 RepID=A0A482VH69_ASBVE|nr:alpha-L-fucosidase-like [Asbolus verrucosus]